MEKIPLIFIVDDSAIVRDLTEHVLKRELDCAVCKYETVEAAKRDLRVLSPDIIILDYNFATASNPFVENGIQLLGYLKKQLNDASVVVFSGCCDSSIRNRCYRSGASAFIDKNEENFIESIVSTTIYLLTERSLDANVHDWYTPSMTNYALSIFSVIVFTLLAVSSMSM